jgi:F-type H+-transporting ATPase subunit b
MQPALLLTIAVAKDPPIIDLDSTVLIQLLIFTITALFLNKFLFQPYLAVKKKRADGIDGAREAARRMEEEAAAKMAEYGQAFNAAKSKANAERGKLQSEAVAREGEIIAATRASVQKATEEAQTKLAADAKAARAQLEPRAQELARTIAEKVLGRKVA